MSSEPPQRKSWLLLWVDLTELIRREWLRDCHNVNSAWWRKGQLMHGNTCGNTRFCATGSNTGPYHWMLVASLTEYNDWLLSRSSSKDYLQHLFDTDVITQQHIRSVERVSAQCCCIPYSVIEIFDSSCNDLELGRFKVIKVKGNGANQKPTGFCPYLTSIVSDAVYRIVFEIFDA